MFRWHKEMNRLDLPAQRVLRLERSLSDVQVALPGFPAQQATAYLCAFAAGQGLRVAVALHLHKSGCLAFYLNDEGEIPKQAGTRVYNTALAFAESMGFMLGDLDIHLLPPEERTALWRSLPLQAGLASGRGKAGKTAAAGPVEEGPGEERGAVAEGPEPGRRDPAGTPARRSGTLAAARRTILENLGRFLASL